MKSYTPNIINSMQSVQAKPLQSTQWNATGNYLKSGSLSVYVKEHVTVNTLKATEFGFNYGHATLTANGGVSILPGVRPSFSIGVAVTNVWTGWKTIK